MQVTCRQAEVVAGRNIIRWCACRGHAGRSTRWLCRKGQAGWQVGVVVVRKANLLVCRHRLHPNDKNCRICRQHAGSMGVW